MKVPRQPEINIGLIGHVDHGKTTLCKALSGEWTDRHSEELKRGISIKLGYADATFYKCPKCAEPECYSTQTKCKICGSNTKLLRVVSFVDAPGHETLMATMLSGAAIMDGALLLIAANETCPQPQTKEHMMALSIMGVKNIVIVQNKIDIVSEKEAMENYLQICEFVKGTIAEKAPIVPVSAHHDVNIDVLIKVIEEYLLTPKFDRTKPARLYVARSFDVNKPGTKPKDLVGGVIGGCLLQGCLKVNDEIEISPVLSSSGGAQGWHTIKTRVTSLFSGGRSVTKAIPGGLIAMGTTLDPAYTKSDGFIGRVVGTPGTLPPILFNLTAEYHLLERVVGTSEELTVDAIKPYDVLMLSVGCTTTVGIVKKVAKEKMEINLKIPICADKGQRMAISRKISGKWRLIGYCILL
jgi:translation initiation factor 2 subunit 3